MPARADASVLALALALALALVLGAVALLAHGGARGPRALLAGSKQDTGLLAEAPFCVPDAFPRERMPPTRLLRSPAPLGASAGTCFPGAWEQASYNCHHATWLNQVLSD